MSKTILEMREERGRAFEELKGLNDKLEAEKRADFYADEQTKWDKLNEAIDGLGEAIREAERKERVDKLQASLTEEKPQWQLDPQRPEDDWLTRVTHFVRGEPLNGRVQKYIDIRFNASEVYGVGKGGNGKEQRDLLTSTSNAPIPTSFIRRLREHLIENSAIRQTNVTNLVTQSGEDIQVPKTTTHPSATLTTEGAAISESDPVFGLITLEAFKYAFITQLSSEFVQDEAVNVLEYLARAGGQALANGSGAHFVTGTGTNQPNGVATASSAGKTGATGQTTTVIGDDLIDLYHSVVSGYRRNSFWLMNDASVAKVRKIKDTTNQYLWQPGLQLGQPDLLLGRPVVADPNVAVMAANAKSILFGDFSSYYIRDVGSVRIERSDEFAFNTDLVTFRFIFRTDGDLVDTNGVKHYANSAT